MTVNEIYAQASVLFVYESDQVCFGNPEYWATLPELERGLVSSGKIKGDCDDFASWCVGKLRENGFRARYVICKTETDEWHCVAESEGLILDNRQAAVVHYFGLPYQWWSISGYAPGEAWHSVSF